MSTAMTDTRTSEAISQQIADYSKLDDNDGLVYSQPVGVIVANLASIARSEHLIADELRRQVARLEERIQTLEVREIRLIDEILGVKGKDIQAP